MTGIIAAMQSELAGLCRVATNVEHHKIHSIDYITGNLDGEDVVMAVCGEGKVNAAVCAQTMLLRFSPARILNTGVAGGISPTLNVPDVAISLAAVQHDYDLSPLGYAKAMVLCGEKTEENNGDGDKATVLFPADRAMANALLQAAEAEGVHAECGVIASGDQFVASNEKKAELSASYQAIACEMEGAAIAQVCHVADLPWCVLRAISDNADDHAPLTFDPSRAAAISIAVTRRALAALRKEK